MDAVLVGVGGVADVHPVGDQGDDVAGGAAVDEGEVAQVAVREGGGEVVLVSDGRGFDDDGACGGTVGDEHLLGAADEFAVDDAVSGVQRDGLKAAGVGQHVEGAAVAGLEDQGGGLVGIGDGGGSGVGGGVVDARHREVDGWDLAHGGVDAEGAASARQLVQNTVDVVVEGDRAERAAHGGVDGLQADRVGARAVGGDVAAEGAERGDAGGADVAGDQCDGAAASATCDADDLVLVGVVGGAGAHCQSDAVERTSGRGARDSGAYCRLGEAAGFQHRAEARSGAGGAAAGQLNAEGAFDAGVGEQLLRGAEVGADEIAVDDIALDRRDAEIADQHCIGSPWSRVGAVGRFDLGEQEALTSEKCHVKLPVVVLGDGALHKRAQAG